MSSPVLDRWYGRLEPNTAKTCEYMVMPFFKWLEVNGGQFKEFGPDELVAWQRAHPGGYDVIDVLQSYITQKAGRVKYKERIVSSVYSLFMHNRAPLPKDAGFTVRGTRPAVVGHLSVADFRLIIGTCNELFRAVFLCMAQGFMGCGELLYFDAHGYEALAKQLEDRRRIIRVELPGRKQNKFKEPYYTFLGKDAKEALRIWLDKRPRDCVEGHVFCTQHGEALQYLTLKQYWLRHLDRLGLVKRFHNGDSSNRYGKGLHEIRDMMRTRWRITGVDVQVAEYFLGHGLDPNQYDKSPRDEAAWFEEQYLLAEPWLNLVSDDPERVPRADVDRQLRELRETQDAELKSIQRRLKLLERRSR